MDAPKPPAMALDASAATPSLKPSAASRSDIRALASGAGIGLAGKILGRLLFIVGQVILARLLGTTVFGLYALGETIFRIAGVISPLGLNNGVIRFASEHQHSDRVRLNRVLVQSVVTSFLSGFLVGVALFLLAPWLERVYEIEGLANVIRLFALATPFVAGLRVTAAASRVSKRMQYAVAAEDIAQPLANLVLLAISYFLGYLLLGAITAAVVSFILGWGIALLSIRRLFPQLNWSQYRANRSLLELISFSLPTAVTGILYMFVLWVDKLMIGMYEAPAEIGIFQAVSQSSGLFALILTGINAIFGPMIADLYARGELTRLNGLFRISTKWGLYLSLPIFLVLMSAPGVFIDLIFGAEYIPGYQSLMILSAGQLVNVGTGAVALILIMSGNQISWLKITLAGFSLNILLNLVLIPRLGITGAAVATSLSIGLLFLSGLVTVRRRLNLWPYDRRYTKGLLAFLLSAALLLLANRFAYPSSFFHLMALASVSAGSFFLTLTALGLDQEDRQLVGLVVRKYRTMRNMN